MTLLSSRAERLLQCWDGVQTKVTSSWPGTQFSSHQSNSITFSQPIFISQSMRPRGTNLQHTGGSDTEEMNWRESETPSPWWTARTSVAPPRSVRWGWPQIQHPGGRSVSGWWPQHRSWAAEDKRGQGQMRCLPNNLNCPGHLLLYFSPFHKSAMYDLMCQYKVCYIIWPIAVMTCQKKLLEIHFLKPVFLLLLSSKKEKRSEPVPRCRGALGTFWAPPAG